MKDQAESLRQLVAREKNPFGQARVVTVTSGKGGVGKSSFSLNFAIALRQKGLRVVLVDADFGLSNLDLMSDITPQWDLSHVLRRQKSLRDVVSAGPAGVGIISGGSGVGDLLQMNEYQLERILTELLTLEELADVIIFDTGAGISNSILRLLRASNDVILVMTPEPTSIMDAYALLKVVSQQSYDCTVKIVVNKAESLKEADTTLMNLERAVRAYLGLTVQRLGCIPTDPTVVKAVKQQVPLLLGFPMSTAAQGVELIARRFLQLPVEAEKRGLSRFFKSFFSREQ